MLNRRELMLILLSVLLSLSFMSLIGACLWQRIKPQGIVEFDVKGTVALFSSELANAQNLSSTQSAALIAEFPQAMNAGIQEYAHDHHVIVVVSPAIAGGADDATAPIQQLIQSNMEPQ